MKLTKLMMSAGIAALVTGTAVAQDTSTETMETPPASAPAPDAMTDTVDMTDAVPALEEPVYASLEEMTVGDVVGLVAYDPNGDQIGEIDYVIDTAGPAEAVIGIGGFLGLGEYTVALPLEEFELRTDGASFELNTDKETLKQAPEFDESTVEGLPPETPVSTLIAANTAPVEDPGAAGAADTGMDTDMGADTGDSAPDMSDDTGSTDMEADPAAPDMSDDATDADDAETTQ